jgi:hypothetical protein
MKKRTALAEFTLKEPLGRGWRAELVQWRLRLQRGRAKPNAIHVTDEAGAAVPFQLARLMRYRDGSLRRTDLHVITDLEPGQEKRFQVWPSASAARQSAGPRLELLDGEHAVISSERLRVRIPWGKKTYRTAAPLSDVPAPILALRGDDGIWFGAGRLVGAAAVRRFRASMVEEGPLFVEALLDYELAGQGWYRVRLRAVAGSPVLLVREEFRAGPGAMFHLSAYPGLRPDRAYWRAHAPAAGKGESKHPGTYVLAYSRSDQTAALQNFYSWDTDVASWYGVFCERANRQDFLGVFPLNGGSWENACANRIRVMEDTAPDLRFEFPLEQGTREWGLTVLPKAEAFAEDPDPFAQPKVGRVMMKYGESPLNEVKERILQWDPGARRRHPRLLFRPQELSAVRERIRRFPPWPAFLRLCEATGREPAALLLATGELRYAEVLRQQVLRGMRAWVDRFLDWGYTDDRNSCISTARSVRSLALQYDLVLSTDVLSAADQRFLDAAFAFFGYVLTDPDYWPPEDRGYPRGPINFNTDVYTAVCAIAAVLPDHPCAPRWLDYCEQELRQDLRREIVPGGAWVEAPNYQAFTQMMLLTAAAIMRNAGRRNILGDARFRASFDYLDDLLTPPDPRFDGSRLLPTVGDTGTLHSQDLRIIFAWAANIGKEYSAFSRRMMRAWKACGSPAFGWHAHVDWLSVLALTDPFLPSTRPQPRPSRALPGYGAVLRSGYGTAQETYLLFKAGPVRGHYHWDEGSFHLYARGAPMALDWGSMYFPRADQPWWHNRISLDHRAEAAVHGPDGRHVAELTDFASVGSADLAMSKMVIRGLARQPEIRENRPHTSADYEPPQEITPSVWRRSVMLLKQPDYVVARDDLESPYPSDWSLHVLADRATQAGARICLAGQHGMALDLFFVAPRKPRAHIGEWGFAYHDFSCDQAAWEYWHEVLDLPAFAGHSCLPVHPSVPEGDERGRFVRVGQASGRPYFVVLFPRRPHEAAPSIRAWAGGDGFKLSLGARREWVWLAAQERTFEDGERAFNGRAGAIRHDGEARELILLDGTRLHDGQLAVEGHGPVSVRAAQGQIEVHADGGARTLALRALAAVVQPRPRVWLDGKLQRLRLRGNWLMLKTPPGRHAFRIGR